MRTSVLITVSLACTLVGVETADPATRAVQALAGADWAGAEAAARQGLERSPQDADLAVVLGIARFEQGDLAGAIGHLDRALAGGTRFAARALLYRGEAHLALGDTTVARDDFARLRRDFPASPEAGRIPDLAGSGVATVVPERRWWHAAVLLSLTNDSHPVSPDTTTSAAGTSDADQILTLLAMAGIAPADWPLRLRLTANRSDYFDRNDLDSTLVQVQAETPFAWNRATLGPRAWIQRLWLDGSRYQDAGHVALAWTQAWPGSWQSDLAPYWERRVYRPPETGRTADALGVDARLTWSPTDVDWFRRLTLIGRYEDAAADQDAYSWVERLVGIKLRFRLPARLDLETDARHRWRQGEGLDPAALVERDERRTELGAALSRSWLDDRLTTEISVRSVDFQAWTGSLTYDQTLSAVSLFWTF